jgi:DNA-binding transcriptional MerR regulator
METEKYYSATETAQLLGISKQTLIRYENKKIFPRPKRNAVNGWREYTEAEIRGLKMIMGRVG